MRAISLWAEELRAAAVMRQRHQGVAGVEITLDGAEIGFHRPESGDDASGNAEFLFGAGKDVGILLHLLAADVEASLADGALGEFKEGLLEDALGPIPAQNLGVDLGVGKSGVGGCRACAGGNCILLDAFKEGGQIAAAGCCRSGWIRRRCLLGGCAARKGEGKQEGECRAACERAVHGCGPYIKWMSVAFPEECDGSKKH